MRAAAPRDTSQHPSWSPYSGAFSARIASERLSANSISPQMEKHLYVVDCGSRHTEVHHMVLAGPRVTERAYSRLRPSSGMGNMPLGEVLADASYGADFLPALQQGLAALGWSDARESTIFVGATGGVRKLLQAGKVTTAQLSEFEGVLKAALQARHSLIKFAVLTGDEEAQYEFSATQMIFSPMFERAGKSKPFFLSGGGATCQFAYGEPVHMCSLDAPMKEMEQKIRDSGHAALNEARAHFETVVDAWWPSSGLPSQLDGSFVGIEMHQDAVSDRAEALALLSNVEARTRSFRAVSGSRRPVSRVPQAQLGFHNAFLTPPQIIAKIDQIEEDLFAQSGDGWQMANKKWGERATKNWPIGAVAGLRLRAILRKLSDSSTIIFAKTAPDARCEVSWPVGLAVLAASGRAPF